MGTDAVVADSQRDALAFTAAMARGDEAACDAILESACLPVMAGLLATVIITLMTDAGIGDPAACIQDFQRKWTTREAA